MKRFRSVRRQLKRGNLQVHFTRIIVGYKTNAVLGGIEPEWANIPKLMRKTNSGRLVPYN